MGKKKKSKTKKKK